MDTRKKRLEALTPAQRERLLSLARAKKSAADGGSRTDDERGPRGDEARPRIVRTTSGPGRYPLAFPQERLFFLDLLEPGLSAYNVRVALRVRGELRRDALSRVIAALVDRHETLRTRFDTDGDGRAVQVVEPGATVALTEARVADEAAIPAFVDAESERPFDLRVAPLLRVAVGELAARDHVVVLTIHHIVSDGWSLGVLVREVTALYALAVEGAAPTLPALAIQYADYASWQRSSLTAAVVEEEIAWWTSELGDVPRLALPFDRSPPETRRHAGGSCAVHVPAEVLETLRGLAREEGATLFMAALAAFQITLARWSDQLDFAIGTPVANRAGAEVEPLVGFFVNTVVLRARLEGAPSFREVVGRVRRSALGAFAHQSVRFERLVDAIAPERRLGQTPIFQVVFALNNTPRDAFAIGGLTIEAVTVPPSTARFDLTLSLSETPDGLRGAMEFDRELFDEGTARAMARSFELVCVGASRDADAPFGKLPVLETAPPSAHAASSPTGRTLDELVFARAEASPDAVAIEDPAGAVTYRALAARASRIASALAARGVGAEARVGLAVTRGVDLVVAALGVMRAGAAFVPLDRDQPAERLAWVANDAEVGLVVTDDDGSTLAGSSAIAVSLAELERSDPSLPVSRARNGGAAYVIHTSGSTGRPKGVIVSHEGVANTVARQMEGWCLGPSDRVLQVAARTFDAWVSEVFSALCGGATVIVAGRAEVAGEPLGALLIAREITLVTLTPTVLATVPDGAYEKLRLIVVAGEACPRELATRWSRGRRLFNAYGPTETSICATMGEVFPGEPIRLGVPLANVEVHVLDDQLAPVPRGMPGELCVGGVGVARGYVGRPDLTAERFVPNPFGHGARLYRTGDRARIRGDATLEYLGRRDDQVKVRGVRIELGEVEAALASNPGVRAAAVVIREDAGGRPQLVAYAVGEASVDELRAHVGQRLPAAMVPAVFVLLDELPRTASGKIDRRALPDGLPAVRDSTAYEAPTEGAATVLASLWSALLGGARVGARDNFFALGGDSILSIQLVARARRAGLVFSVADVFRHPTLGALAQAARRAGAEPVDQEKVVGTAPLTAIQRWFFAQDRVAPSHFNHSLALTVRSDVTDDMLRSAVDALLVQHDALTARFPREEAGARSMRFGDGTITAHDIVDVLDVTGLALEEQDAAIERLCADAQTRLDLERGPIVRVVFARRGGDRDSVAVLVVHHLVVDGVSWRILVEDLERALDSAARAEPIDLGPKTASFATWSRRQWAHAATPMVIAQAARWAEILAEDVAPLPAGEPGSVAETVFLSASLEPEETSAILRELPGAYRSEANDALLAAFALGATRVLGGAAIRISLEGHGRETLAGVELDTTRTVGWFTAAYPVVLRVAPDRERGSTLKIVKEQLRGSPERGIGFGLLRWGSDLLGDASLPEIAFNYLGQVDPAPDRARRVGRSAVRCGPVVDPRERRLHRIGVSSIVGEGRLRVTVTAGPTDRAIAQELLDAFLDELRALALHAGDAAAGGLTPSDVPLTGAGQRELDALTGTYGVRQVEDVYPLSPLQAGILFHALDAPGTGVYVEQLSCIVVGDVDASALKNAFEEIVARHGVLRTAFVVEPFTTPMQVVLRHVTLPFQSSTIEGRAGLAAWLQEDRRRGFELHAAPLLRVALLDLGAGERAVVLTFHHLLLDGWSVGVVLGEVLAVYDARLRGVKPKLGPVHAYRDYVAHLATKAPDEARAYWRRTLRGFDEPTRLPLELAPAERGETRWDEARHALSREATATITRFVQHHQLTVPALLEAAWALVLGRVADTEDVVFGVTVAGRPAELPGVETRTGLFINTVALRVAMPPGERALAFLRRLSNERVDLRAFEHTPLTEAHAASDVPRDQPLFETFLVFENFPVDQALRGRRSSLSIREVLVREQTTYPLGVVAHGGEQLTLRILYDAGRFEPTAATRLLAWIANALRSLVDASDPRLGEIDPAGAVEASRSLQWARSQRAARSPATLHSLVARWASTTPDALAVDTPTEAVTYAALQARAAEIAHRLRAAGVTRGARVGLALGGGVGFVSAALGAMMAGAAYVPLDPTHPVERLQFLATDAAVACVVVDDSSRDVAASLPGVRLELAGRPDDARGRLPEVSSGELAYVYYTSGSTGRPKGVMIEHRAVVNTILAQIELLGAGPGTRLLQVASLGFDASVWEIFTALVAGATLVVASRDDLVPGEPLRDVIQARSVTMALLTPTALAALPDAELPSLSVLVVGGEACSRELAARWASGRTLIDAYGPTEVAIIATMGRLEVGAPVRIGAPLPNVDAYVLDRAMQPCPEGVAGELYVGGDGLARGYFGRPDLTAERFVPSPFDAGARLYRTGDVCRAHEGGALEYVGRRDAQVKVRGVRIELGEVEAAIASHPAVRLAAATTQPDGDGRPELVGYVVGEGVSTESIRSWVERSLPRGATPTAWVFLDDLPRTPNGKIDRRALPRPSLREVGTHLPPRTGVGEILAAIWAEVLHVDRVSGDASFFTLGGHSLTAVQVASRVRRALDVDMPLRALFEAPTLDEYADRVEAAVASAATFSRPALVRADRGAVLPLSFSQERLYFLDQLQPGSPAYNLSFAVRVRGELAVDVLRRSFDVLVERHESLRTTFRSGDGLPPHARISAAGGAAFELRDLSAEPAEARVRAAASDEAKRAFDLERGPLFRVVVLRLSPAEHVVLLGMHHIVSDGWSMTVLVRELVVAYAAVARGEEPALEPLAFTFADHAAWQRSFLHGERLDREIAYWKTQLADSGHLTLPTDRPRPPEMTYRGASLPMRLRAGIGADLRALCGREGVTPFMALAGLLQVLLGRYAGQDDVTLGIPVANRTPREIEGVVGFFVNTFALRTRFEDDPSVRDLLARVRETALQGYLHQDVPFDRVVEAASPTRDLGRSPLFQVMFAFNNLPDQRFEAPGLSFERVTFDLTTARFDLTLSLREEGDDIAGSLEYNTDLFDEPTVAAMMTHFDRIVCAAVSDPERRVRSLEILTSEERERALVTWNATEAPYPEDTCLHELFESSVDRAPSAIAVAAGEVRFTYRELEDRANEVATWLRERGARPNELVAVVTNKGWEQIVAVLGVLKAGAAYLPLDPGLPPDRFRFVVEHAGVRLGLGQPMHLAHEGWAPSLERRAISLETPSPTPRPPRAQRAGDLAYVLYTSGSTGVPKGVAVDHVGPVNTLLDINRRFEVGAGDAVLFLSALSFDLSVYDIFGTLAAGGTVVVPDAARERDPAHWAELLASEQITIWDTVPAFLEMLVEHAESGGGVSAPRLRHALLSGDWLPLSLPDRARAVFPGLRVTSGGGATEASVWSILYPIETVDPAWPSVPYGRPMDNQRFYVLDTVLEPCPPGVLGELYIGGIGLAQGYFRDDERTRASFFPHPRTGERLYRTGDLGRYRRDGVIQFLGRRDGQVKIRGFRIELGDVEAALRQHASVRECIVIVRGEAANERRLVAYVVPAQAGVLDVEALFEHVRGKLPSYMVPTAIVRIDALPLTSNGKVNRAALPEPEVGADGHDDFVPPAEGAEATIASIWRELLRVERVGATDNFFRLGGDSILSIQVSARARRAGLSFSVAELFRNPTIAELARVARVAESKAQDDALVVGSSPLTPVQRWFLAQPRASFDRFNQAIALASDAGLSDVALTTAVGALLAHHDVLRSRFVRDATGETRQEYGETRAEDVLTSLDVAGLDDAARGASFARGVEDLHAGFDLREGPLFRVLHVSAGPEAPATLVLIAHHLIMDTVSWRIVAEDLASAYATAKRGDIPALPPKTTSFSAWASRLETLRADPAVLSETGYWRAAAEPLAPLPRDVPDGENLVRNTATVSVTLDEEETSTLLRGAPEFFRAGMNDVLLAAWALACARFAGTSRVRVDLEAHGRDALEDVDVTRTVGWFTSLYPVTLDVPASRDVAATLKAVKEHLRAVPRKGLGFGVLRDAGELGDPATGEVSFNYLGQVAEDTTPGAGVQPFRHAVSCATGAPDDPAAPRPHALDVVAVILAGKLRFTVHYASTLHARATIERLVASVVEALRAMGQASRGESAGGFTPSDFPLAQISQAALDKFARTMGKKRR